MSEFKCHMCESSYKTKAGLSNHLLKVCLNPANVVDKKQRKKKNDTISVVPDMATLTINNPPEEKTTWETSSKGN